MKVSVAALAALILVGCGSQDKNANEAAAGNAQSGAAGNAAGSAGAETGGPAPGPAPSGARQMQPGQWEMATQIISIEMPGAPPQAQAQMRAQQGRVQTDRRCITPEQAADPTRDLVGSGTQSRNCQFSDRIWAGGVIRVSATCRQPGGGPSQAQLAMAGSFTATTIEATLTVNAVAPGRAGTPGLQRVRASSAVRGRRVGECPARGAAPPVRMPMPPPAPPRP